MKYIDADWPAPSHIKAYTTTRIGWGGKNPHQADYNEDDNHQLQSLLNLPDTPIWLKQTHSTIAVAAVPENHRQIGDAAYSDLPQRTCAILTADCLPILLCNRQGTHIAAIHAGWRGLAQGIIESTLAALKLPPSDILVWLGPAIGPANFEVGQDVYDAFTQIHSSASLSFKPHTPGKWLADLYGLAKMRLALQNIHQVYGGNFCTFTQDDLFFSYRRNKGETGRMASVIWVDK